MAHMASLMNSVEQIVRNGLCTGCGLCAGIAPDNIQMRMTDAGYLRPQVSGQIPPEANKDIEAACPGMVVAHQPSKTPYHPIWGPIEACRTGYSTDGDVRRQGSSGGGISALLIHLLETKQIDFAAHIAVSNEDPLRNELQLSATREDVIRGAGSRYAPAAPLARLGELIQSGKRYAFVGKPCDVAALRQYLRRHPALQERIPYLLSFMCAGTPSLKGTHQVIRKLGFQPQEVVKFRYRGDGWPGMAKAETEDGRSAEMDYSSSWGTVLNQHLQFRCKICPDGTGEFADVVCADAWYGKDGYPDFAERDGRSLILSRTPKGEALVQEAAKAKAIDMSELPVDDLAKMQPYQLNRKTMVLGRAIATRLRLGQAPKYTHLGLVKASIQAKPIEWLRNAAGTYRRAKGEIA